MKVAGFWLEQIAVLVMRTVDPERYRQQLLRLTSVSRT